MDIRRKVNLVLAGFYMLVNAFYLYGAARIIYETNWSEDFLPNRDYQENVLSLKLALITIVLTILAIIASVQLIRNKKTALILNIILAGLYLLSFLFFIESDFILFLILTSLWSVPAILMTLYLYSIRKQLE